MQDPISVINLAAHALALKGAVLSVGTRVTVSFYMFPRFDWKSVILINYIRPDKVTKKTDEILQNLAEY